jgi:hypothetical protein
MTSPDHTAPDSAENSANTVKRDAIRKQGRLIGLGLLVAGLVLGVAGLYFGPYSVWWAGDTGKISVEECGIGRRPSATSARSTPARTKTVQCYGTFHSDNGAVKDLNAHVETPYHVYQRGDQVEVRQIRHSFYTAHTWVTLSRGLTAFFGGLLACGLGLLFIALSARFAAKSATEPNPPSEGEQSHTLAFALLTIGAIGGAICAFGWIFP